MGRRPLKQVLTSKVFLPPMTPRLNGAVGSLTPWSSAAPEVP